MTIVSDASSLGSLALVDYLWLLEALYGTVVISEVVAQELATAKNARIQAVLSVSWVKVQVPTEGAIAQVQQQGKQFDLGETQTLALALQLHADELLINERRGRQVAQALELSAIGIVGIVIVAKQRALIPSVRRVMDALVELAGFRISHQLYQKVLKFVDEI
ncbi:DUF3368 domain-containing protein [Phormidium tenue]|uniref:Nucleic acid-binding protein n=1 Tax=Phormidium tenue NIES-30 TaxID=549789 RepID=A0A1U7J559_9CYAN|nr:DUF3368 domain-containing protein [Phormidium tenue]MBD2232663.1 DUF3368 domain-containing protein [Phormidium tenue FACHB-1052]OKH47791.1 nucleic acid-binding protein [Phormidium tenue NIES-30]